MEKSISIFIPAFNEAEGLMDTIKTIEKIRNQCRINSQSIEYIIVDDGSKDSTGDIAEDLAKRHSNVKVIHNIFNRGLGYSLKVAIDDATKEYFMLIPGDNETTEKTIHIIFQAIQEHEYDIYIPYQGNSKARPMIRRVLSRIYTQVFNILFGMRLRYFNGLCAFKLTLLKKAKMMTSGPSSQAGTLIQLIKQRKASYLEIPMYVNPQPGRKSRLLKWKNVFHIAKHIYDLKQHMRKSPST